MTPFTLGTVSTTPGNMPLFQTMKTQPRWLNLVFLISHIKFNQIPAALSGTALATECACILRVGLQSSSYDKPINVMLLWYGLLFPNTRGFPERGKSFLTMDLLVQWRRGSLHCQASSNHVICYAEYTDLSLLLILFSSQGSVCPPKAILCMKIVIFFHFSIKYW